jgi:hypothetical protein
MTITRLIDKHYRAVSTGLGIMVASCTTISAGLLRAADPPDGLRVLDPVATKATVLVLLAVPGALLPMLAARPRPPRCPRREPYQRSARPR